MDEHIVELETKVAYLERNLEDLNEVVTSQQKDIDLLKNRVAVMVKYFQTDGPQMDLKDEPPPPHY